jgi:hypothetical protein
MSFPIKIAKRPGLKPWHVVVIVLAVVSLTGSLATRTFDVAINQSRTAQATSVDSVRQHMDRDATGWTAPAPVISILNIPVFSPRPAPRDPQLPNFIFEVSFYNRPPPAFLS